MVFGQCLAQQKNCPPLHIGQVLNRSLPSALRAKQFIGAGDAISTWAELIPANITLLAVPDDAIETVGTLLTQHHLLSQGSVVFHCSGAKSSHTLHALRAQGAVVASVHPVRSFANPQDVATNFAGTICSIEGDAYAIQVLSPLLL